MPAVALDDVFQDRIADNLLLGGMILQEFEKLLVFDDLRGAIYVKANLFAEIDEQQPHVRILGNVSETRHHAVAAILGIRDRALVEYLDESRMAASKRRIGVPLGIRSPDEHHFLASEKRLHRGIEMVEHLVPIERHRMSRFAVFLLQAM